MSRVIFNRTLTNSGDDEIRHHDRALCLRAEYQREDEVDQPEQRSLYVAAYSARSRPPSKQKSGEPHASLRSRTCAVDLAPLLRAPLFMSNGIQGRGMPLIPCTRWPDTEPCHFR